MDGAVTYMVQRRLVLEAITVGTFLRDVELQINRRHEGLLDIIQVPDESTLSDYRDDNTVSK